MPSYQFSGRDRAGRKVEGVLTEESAEKARELARRAGLGQLDSLERSPLGDLRLAFKSLRPVPHREISQSIRQLQVMLAAGIPLGRTLEVLARTPGSPELREAWGRAETLVQEGATLSAGLAASPRLFSRSLVALLKVGEGTGQLLAILPRLAANLEVAEQRRHRMLAALTYPAFMLVMSGALWLAMLVFYLPRMAEVLANLQVHLAWPIELVLSLGRLLSRPAPALLALECLAFALLLAFLWLRSRAGRDFVERLCLRLPGLRETVQAYELSRLSGGLALVTHSGVPLLEGLSLLGPGLTNRPLREAVDGARREMIDGMALSEAFRTQPALDPLLASMAEVGEATGLMAPVLEKLEQIYASQLEARLEMLTALLEPAIMGLMGLLVGGTVIVFMLPLAQLVNRL